MLTAERPSQLKPRFNLIGDRIDSTPTHLKIPMRPRSYNIILLTAGKGKVAHIISVT